MVFLAIQLYILGMVITHGLLILYDDHPQRRRSMDLPPVTPGKIFIACAIWPVVAIGMLIIKEPK